MLQNLQIAVKAKWKLTSSTLTIPYPSSLSYHLSTLRVSQTAYLRVQIFDSFTGLWKSRTPTCCTQVSHNVPSRRVSVRIKEQSKRIVRWKNTWCKHTPPTTWSPNLMTESWGWLNRQIKLRSSTPNCSVPRLYYVIECTMNTYQMEASFKA